VSRRRPTAAALAPVALALLLTAGCGSKIPAPEDPPDRYVALGDSYTSGPGIPEVVDTPCYRSSNNYPHQVAARLDNTTLVDVSCAGAATKGMTGSQNTGLSIEEPQLAAVTPDTDLVTISLGANDSHYFSSVVVGCTLLRADDPTGAPCREQYATDPDYRLGPVVAEMEDQLELVLGQIQDRAPDARIVFVGYPQIVPASGTCDLLPLATGDYPFVRAAFQQVIDAQRQAAEVAGVDFVDVQALADGHDICADDPWVAGALSRPGGSAWHPYLAEQAAVAEAVLALVE
jgi:lysophospholipase L1-like esterase